MKNNKLKIAILVFFGIIIGVEASLFLTTKNNQNTSLGGIADSGCTVSSVAMKTVGHQLSSTILSAAGNRAWAIIQQPINATNTVNVVLDEGNAATITSGIQLSSATTSNSMSSFVFGRNTDMPYIGAVTGITNIGSTTVNVIECLY